MIQAPEAVEKSHPIILKATQKFFKPKNAKIFVTKLKLKVQNIYIMIKPILKP
jgi:hypothetical protein